MFGRQIELFRILGFKIRVDFSWLFLALLITWSLAKGYFPALYQDLPVRTYWWMGVAGAIGLFFSLVFHELSHSLVARRFGLQMKGITLFIFGGVAEMEEEPASPQTEFFMAFAGPIASAFLAVVFFCIVFYVDLPLPVLGVAHYLSFLNGILAVFNLVPAFPLDGGRVLRSLLWLYRGDLRWATRIASGIGGAFGGGLILVGLLFIVTGNFVGGMWWCLIGFFLRTAASASYFQLEMRNALQGEPVERFMTPDPVTVPRNITVREFIEDYVYHYYHDMFPVAEGSRLFGWVTTRQLKDVPKDKWGAVTIGDIMMPLNRGNSIDAHEDSLKAISIMQHSGNSRLMVTHDGALVGVVSLKDILKLLELKVDLENPAHSP